MDEETSEKKPMKLKPFHVDIAKRIAQGQKNREILQEVQISASRLSILKGKPEFQAEEARYMGMQEKAYARALEVFEDAAENVAREMVALVTDPETPEKVRLEAGEAILDRLAQAEMLGEINPNYEGEEVTFEHLLRMTKRSAGGVAKGSETVRGE